MEQLELALTESLATLNCQLWGYEFASQGRHGLLRVYIDKPEGITIDDCAIVTGQLNSTLQAQGLLNRTDQLEVSSPGVERRLFKLDQYQTVIGNSIKVKLKKPLFERINWSGELTAVTDTEIVLQTNDETVTIPYNSIQRGQVILVAKQRVRGRA